MIKTNSGQRPSLANVSMIKTLKNKVVCFKLYAI